jgi:hypothetical protein
MIAALIAKIGGTFLPYLMAGTVIVLAFGGYSGWVYNKGYHNGVEAQRLKVEKQDAEAAKNADEGRDAVRECWARDGMRWDRSTGKCVRRVPSLP